MRQLKAVVVVLISAVAIAQERALPDAGADAGIDGGQPSRRGTRRSDDQSYYDRERERAERERERERDRERAERERERDRAERDRAERDRAERDRAERDREKERYYARRSGSGGSGYSYGGDMTSVLSGKTLGGGTVVHAQFGWPGISATLLTSASRNIDIGARLSLLYAYEGITTYPGYPGLKLQGVVRLALLERGRINLGLELSPGFVVYSYGGASWVGLTVPVGLAFGYELAPNLMLSLGVDVPFFFPFGWADPAVPVRVGAGLEYALDRSLALTLSLRGGPYGAWYRGGWDTCYDPWTGTYYACGRGGYYYSAAMEALIGLSYRL